jgi:FixJ family two-component response regulator
MTNNQGAADQKPSFTIFVVDDDPDVRRAMKRLLKTARFKVETFATAEDFLKTEPCRSPGVLVLDMRLPGMDGLDLQKALAASGSAMPVVFMTAYEDAGQRQEAMDRGGIAFLQKPVDEKVLFEAIRKAEARERTKPLP